MPPSIGEMKTKPTQYAVRTLNSAGIQPDFVIGRSPQPMDEPRKTKIAQFCSVPTDHIISAPDARSVYDIPDEFEQQDFANKLLKHFGLEERPSRLEAWKSFTDKALNATDEVRIGVVGKYFSTGDFTLSDVYISVLEAIKHAAAANNVKVKIDWLNAEEYEKNPAQLEQLRGYQGVLIPGGFGSRGIEGKIAVINYVRKNNIPYFGLCYGMQCAVIEYARTELGWADANTTEINEHTSHPVVHLQSGQEQNIDGGKMGGTMRLGSFPCHLAKDTFSRNAYMKEDISERHRHRYEFNNAFRLKLEEAGLVIAGTSPDNHFVEIVEVKNHPFFIGVQFHPEFQSRPLDPHPLFVAFIQAAKEQ